MTSRRQHIASLVPAALLAITIEFHPGYIVAMAAGVLLPEIDAVTPRLHRSWIFHTALIPAIGYQFLLQSGVAELISQTVLVVHFATVGILFHLLFDFVYPKEMEHAGAEWPVRPTIFSEPWGLMWLGLSWFTQWFIYLSPAFVPWLLGL